MKLEIDQINDIARAALAALDAELAGGMPEAIRVYTLETLEAEAWLRALVNTGLTLPADWPEGIAEMLAADTRARMVAGVASVLRPVLSAGALLEPDTPDLPDPDAFPGGPDDPA